MIKWFPSRSGPRPGDLQSPLPVGTDLEVRQQGQWDKKKRKVKRLKRETQNCYLLSIWMKYLEIRIYRSTVRINNSLSKVAGLLIHRNQLYFYNASNKSKWNDLKGNNIYRNILKSNM